MLLTTCPNCAAQFKVQPEQLNVRQGRVMCGRCRQVFNAFQSLTRISDNDAIAAAAPATESHEAAELQPDTSAAAGLFLREEPPVPTLLHDAPPEARVPGPEFDTPAEIVDPPDEAALAMTEQAAVPAPVPPESVEAEEKPLQWLPDDQPQSAADATNPLLADIPGQRREPAARSRGWAFGAVVLALVLVAQSVYLFRATLVRNYPQLRPAFVAACDWLGCSRNWARDDTDLRIEASDLIEAPGQAGRIQLTATLVNRGGVPQDFPALELKLTDSANQVLLSRILQPQEYLGRTPAREESLQPNAETYVNLNIEVANKLQASGYGVRAFYP